VIKVEVPSGEVTRRLTPLLPGTSVSFTHATVNRNERSLTLDMRRPEGRDIFLKLAAIAVVIGDRNFRPFASEYNRGGTANP